MDEQKQHVKADQAEIVENEKETSDSEGEFIEQPAKVMRVGSMLRQLLDELREAQLDEGSRDRMRDIYDTSVQELGSALSSELKKELDRITLPFGTDEIPSEAELRVAQAQLVGRCLKVGEFLGCCMRAFKPLGFEKSEAPFTTCSF